MVKEKKPLKKVMGKFYSLKEVADYFRVSPRTIVRYRNAPPPFRLNTTRFGWRIMCSEAQIKDFMVRTGKRKRKLKRRKRGKKGRFLPKTK